MVSPLFSRRFSLPFSSFQAYLLLPLLNASKPDLGWLTIINFVVGNGGRVMVNWLR
jgi:hypothetical protein